MTMSHRPEARSPGISRRSALRAGASLTAAAVLTPLLAGTAEANQHRRLIDGATDSAPAIQQQIDDAAAAGGGTVQLAAGEFLIGSPLLLRSGVTLVGAGIGVTVLREHSTLGARAILRIVGSTSIPVIDAGVEGVTISNGAATTGSVTVGMDGLVIDQATDINVTDCEIAEIQGLYGLRAGHLTGLTVDGCRFYRNSYAMLMLFPECDTVSVTGSEFDTVTSTAYANTYMFATGSESYGSGEYFVRNVTVADNTFRHNPLWIGINTHGGDNITIRDNVVEDTKYGILCSPAAGHVTEPVLSNLVIEGNTVSQGAAADTIAGIVVAGGPTIQVRHVRIEHNQVQGFGGQYNTYGSITVYRITDVIIAHNSIEDFANYGVCFPPNSSVFGAVITGNTIRNLALVAPGAEGCTGAIGALNDGMYGLEVRDNTLDADSVATTADWFIYSTGVCQSWQIDGSNTIDAALQAVPYANLVRLPIRKDTMPSTGLQQKAGDVLYDTAWLAAWVVASPTVGYGAMDTTTVVVNVSTTVGSTRLVVGSGGTYSAACLPPGMNVKIVGAGAGGATLLARVVDNPAGGFIDLDTAAGTTLSSAPVTYQQLVLQAG